MGIPEEAAGGTIEGPLDVVYEAIGSPQTVAFKPPDSAAAPNPDEFPSRIAMAPGGPVACVAPDDRFAFADLLEAASDALAALTGGYPGDVSEQDFAPHNDLVRRLDRAVKRLQQPFITVLPLERPVGGHFINIGWHHRPDGTLTLHHYDFGRLA